MWQYGHGYGRVSEWISRWVDSVDERLNVFPHWRHKNDLPLVVVVPPPPPLFAPTTAPPPPPMGV